MKLQESASTVVDHYVGTVVPSDTLIHETLIGWLFENRIQKLISQTKEVNTSHDSAAEHRTPDAVIKHLTQRFDPTEGKVHTEHLLKWYQGKHFRQEDHEHIRGLLKRYEKNRKSLPFKPQDFESPNDLKNALDTHLGITHISDFAKSMSPQDRDAVERGSEQVHDDEHFEIRKLRSKAHHLGASVPENNKKRRIEALHRMAEQDPHSRKAMQILGTGTKWCTTPERTVQKGKDLGRNTMFEHYSTHGPLYWIHDKKNNRRHVFVEGDRQLVDEHDNNSYINFDERVELDPKLKPIEHLLHKFNYTEEKDKALSGQASTQELESYLNSDSGGLALYAMQHFGPHLVHKHLVDQPHENVYVRRLLANHKKISPETIHYALVTKPDKDRTVRWWLRKHRNISQKTKDALGIK